MKGKYVFLDELNANTKSYKVKVKVVDKTRPKKSPQKKMVYQSLTLEDDKGNRMRGALFGDQVEGYKEAMVYNGVYEISNAPLKATDPRWKSDPAEMDFQMSFGGQTSIEPVECQSRLDYPEYRPLLQIPKSAAAAERIDVIGVVLYVEEKAREVTVTQNRQMLVREIVVADHSSAQPITISAWNDLAEDECEVLASHTPNFKVIGFTALKVSTYKGFSLATTMSTNIIHYPEGDKAVALKTWASLHTSALNEMQTRVLNVRQPAEERPILTIAQLRQKKIKTTLQEERQWIGVHVPQPDLENVHAYIGCSKCNKGIDMPPGGSFDCKNCNRLGCVAVPKVSFNCDVSDGHGTLAVTTFNEEAEKLFRMSIPDIFKMAQSADHDSFARVAQRISTENFLIEVGPKLNLYLNKVLQWGLRKVVMEDPEDSDSNVITNTKDIPDGVNPRPSTPPCSMVGSEEIVSGASKNIGLQLEDHVKSLGSIVTAVSKLHKLKPGRVPEIVPTTAATDTLYESSSVMASDQATYPVKAKKILEVIPTEEEQEDVGSIK